MSWPLPLARLPWSTAAPTSHMTVLKMKKPMLKTV
jgi:hypothetical protein